MTALRDHIAESSPHNAAAVAKRIVTCVELLAVHPQLGRPGRIFGTRELVITGTPYIAPYRVRAERIELIAIFHGRQKWPSRL